MRRILPILGILLFAGVIVGWIVAAQIQIAKIAETHSAVASLTAALEKSSVVGSLESDWRIFSDEEYDEALAALHEAGASIDAGRHCQTQQGVLGDAWGNRLQIAARKNDDGRVDVIVWSKGPDRKSGTDDDIVVPVDKTDEIREIAAGGRERNDR